MDARKPEAQYGRQRTEETREQFDCVCASLVDVHSRMAAVKPSHTDPNHPASFRERFRVQVQIEFSEKSTCAPDVDGALFLGVQVEEDPASQQIPAKAEGSGEPSFFVHGEQKLKGPVQDIPALHDSQHGCNAHTVVCAQRGSFRPDPFAFSYQPEGVPGKVMDRVPVLFTDHVQMTLEYHPGAGFPAGAGSLFHHGIAHAVRPKGKPVFSGKAQDVVPHPRLVSGAAWNPADMKEMSPERFRFESLQYVIHHAIHSCVPGDIKRFPCKRPSIFG